MDSHYIELKGKPRIQVSKAEFDTFTTLTPEERFFAYMLRARMTEGHPDYQLSYLDPKTPEPAVAASVEEFTGGSSSYYMVSVTNPTTITDPYDAECNDIIEALQMNYAEGNAFKAIWRRCAARLGKQKKGYDNGLYDAEKVKFFGERMIEQSKESN